MQITESGLLITAMVAVSFLLISLIVILVVYFVWKLRGSRMQEGYGEERYLGPVPGYDDDN